MTEAIACIWGWSGHVPPSAEKLRAAASRGGAAALLEPGVTPALRLGGDDGRRHRPEALADHRDHAARLAAVHAEVARHADLFSRSQRQFLDAYFRFAQESVAGEADALAGQLAWSGGLFAPADLVFAALRPLPRAMVLAGEKVVAADFAFWDGEALAAVSVTSGPSTKLPEPTPEYLRRIIVAPAELAAGPAIFADPRFPQTLRRFFERVAMPQGPFRPHGLPEKLSPAQEEA